MEDMVDANIKQKVAIYLMKKKKLEEEVSKKKLGLINELFDELAAAAKERQDDPEEFFKWFMATAFEDRWLHEEEKLTR